MTDYEYHGLMAEAWDILRGDTSQWPDRFFYLDLVKKHGQPVLDVGCGTGRILLDFLGQGIDIDGIDNSPEMLVLCRRKSAGLGLSPNLYQQTMQEMVLPRSYQTILVPSSSLQLVIEPDQAVLAVRRFYEHLLPGGTLAAPFMTLWKEGNPLDSTDERQAVRSEDGAVIRRFSWSSYDPITQCESTRDEYQLIVDGKIVTEEHHQRSPATRSYTQDQARALFEEAGFFQVTLYREFTFEPAQPEDTLFSVVGLKGD